jgi:hypothetical protein
MAGTTDASTPAVHDFDGEPPVVEDPHALEAAEYAEEARRWAEEAALLLAQDLEALGNPSPHELLMQIWNGGEHEWDDESIAVGDDVDLEVMRNIAFATGEEFDEDEVRRQVVARNAKMREHWARETATIRRSPHLRRLLWQPRATRAPRRAVARPPRHTPRRRNAARGRVLARAPDRPPRSRRALSLAGRRA